MPHRNAVAGILLAAMVVMTVLAGIDRHVSVLWAGALAWAAAALLWRRLRRQQRHQARWLAGIGVLGMLIGAIGGARPNLSLVVAGNQSLIGLLTAVAFLKLVATVPGEGEEPPPRGQGAVWRTLLGVHLFGAVINMSSVFLLGDRMVNRGGRRLGRRRALVLSRGFATGAFWSPFFAAMAAAVTYAPGAQVPIVVLTGLPLAAFGLWLTAREVDEQRTGNAPGAPFIGYPMRFSTLWLPCLLVTLVLVGHTLLPQWSILTWICLGAPLLTLLVLLLRKGRSGPAQFGHYITQRLGDGASELTLFLAAGVLAAGIASVLSLAAGYLPFTEFGPAQASMLLLVIVGAAFVGVHPVIAVTVCGTWLAPLHPEPTLLAATFTMGWAIGVPAGPLSGLHLAMQGRYGISPYAFQRWNGRYIPQLLLASIIALHLQAWIRH